MANQLKKKFLGNDQVDGDKILLEQGQSIKAKDASNVEQDLLKFGPAGEVLVGAANDEVAIKSESVQKSGDTMSGSLTVDDGAGSTAVVAGGLIQSTNAPGPGITDSGEMGGGTIALNSSSPDFSGSILLESGNPSQFASYSFDDIVNGTNAVGSISPQGISATFTDAAGVSTTGSYQSGGMSISEIDGANSKNFSVDLASGVSLYQDVGAGPQPVAPTQEYHLAPKKYVDDEIAAESSALQLNIDAVADDVSHLVTLSGVAVDSDNLGSFTGTTIADDQNIKQALQALETAVESVSGGGSSTQLELDATQLGAGLAADGSYVQNIAANYISGSTSLHDATQTLDSEIFNVQSELDSTQQGAGLEADGSYLADAGANYIQVATSLKDADSILDENINLARTDITNLQNEDLTFLKLDGSRAMEGNLNMMNGLVHNKIVGLADPTDPRDAVNKQYVDAIAEGLHVHAPAKVLVYAPLAGSVTYDNGSSGQGATLTLGTALTSVDDYSLQNGDRIIIAGQANQAHNGIYTWATGGTVLTRAEDFNSIVEAAGGDFVFVQEGTQYGNTGWVMTETATAIGTSPIIFLQFSGAGSYTAGDALSLLGSEFNVLYDGSSIGVNGSNELYVPMGGIGSNELAADSVTSDKIADNAVTQAQIDSSVAGDAMEKDPMSGKLDVRVDGTRIGIDGSNQLYIPMSGVNTSELANDSVTADKIAANAVTQEQIDSSVAGDAMEKDPMSGKLDVRVDGTRIGINGSNQLYIPLLGVGTSELANDSVTADKIADNAVTSAQIDSSVAGDALEKDPMSGKLDVRVDGTRIGINGSNQLYIPLLGVGTSELANDSVTADKIAANAVTQEQVDSSVAGNGIEKDLISGKLNVKLDGSSLAVSASGLKSNIVWDDAFFNLTATDITNGYVDLSVLAEPKSIIGFVDRLAMFEGQDYIVSTVGGVSRITFAGDMIPPGSSVLDDSDNLYFKFQKKEV